MEEAQSFPSTISSVASWMTRRTAGRVAKLQGYIVREAAKKAPANESRDGSVRPSLLRLVRPTAKSITKTTMTAALDRSSTLPPTALPTLETSPAPPTTLVQPDLLKSGAAADGSDISTLVHGPNGAVNQRELMLTGKTIRAGLNQSSVSLSPRPETGDSTLKGSSISSSHSAPYQMYRNSTTTTTVGSGSWQTSTSTAAATPQRNAQQHSFPGTARGSSRGFANDVVDTVAELWPSVAPNWTEADSMFNASLASNVTVSCNESWLQCNNGTGEGGLVDEKEYWALILVLFPLFTVFGNVLVILSVYKERSLQSATNYFIVSLAIADLLVATLVMPFAVYVLVCIGAMASIRRLNCMAKPHTHTTPPTPTFIRSIIRPLNSIKRFSPSIVVTMLRKLLLADTLTDAMPFYCFLNIVLIAVSCPLSFE